jgi:hypothetical protein
MATLCLTVDIDWAHDTVIQDTLEIFERFAANATWFATHETSTLRIIEAAGDHEIGLHPNFNPLLDGQGGTARDILLRLKELAPEARSVRSHSLMRSSRLSSLFVSEGLTHESNYVVPPSVGVSVMPWRDFNGLVQVPITWEDDLRLIDKTFGEPACLLGVMTWIVVNVHPIHVFLNSVTIDQYESARPHFNDPCALLARRRPTGSGGTRDRLISLLETARAESVGFARVLDINVK